MNIQIRFLNKVLLLIIALSVGVFLSTQSLAIVNPFLFKETILILGKDINDITSRLSDLKNKIDSINKKIKIEKEKLNQLKDEAEKIHTKRYLIEVLLEYKVVSDEVIDTYLKINESKKDIYKFIGISLSRYEKKIDPKSYDASYKKAKAALQFSQMETKESLKEIEKTLIRIKKLKIPKELSELKNNLEEFYLQSNKILKEMIVHLEYLITLSLIFGEDLYQQNQEINKLIDDFYKISIQEQKERFTQLEKISKSLSEKFKEIVSPEEEKENFQEYLKKLDILLKIIEEAKDVLQKDENGKFERIMADFQTETKSLIEKVNHSFYYFIERSPRLLIKEINSLVNLSKKIKDSFQNLTDRFKPGIKYHSEYLSRLELFLGESQPEREEKLPLGKIVTEEVSFPIDSTFTSVSFTLWWDVKDYPLLEFKLKRPDGKIIDQIIAKQDPLIELIYSPDIGHITYRISPSQFGTWTMLIIGPKGMKYNASVSGVTSLKLEWNFDKNVYYLNEPMIISTYITDPNPVLGAEVIATIERYKPKRESFSLSLYDDGKHNDVDASDGFYANTFIETTSYGSYCVKIKAIGKSNRGDHFIRDNGECTVVSQDSDGDGISDTYEYLWGLNKYENDAKEDLDKDGLTNLEEFEYNRRSENKGKMIWANQRDSDNDGFSDKEELDNYSDPGLSTSIPVNRIPPENEWQIYIDEQFSFSLKYPINWYFQEYYRSQFGFLKFISISNTPLPPPEKDFPGLFSPALRIDISISTTSLDTLISRIENKKNFHGLKKEEIIINDKKGLKFAFVNEKTKRKGFIVLLEIEDNKVLVIASDDISQAWQVVNTLKIEKE